MAEENNNDWSARSGDQPAQPNSDAQQTTSMSPVTAPADTTDTANATSADAQGTASGAGEQPTVTLPASAAAPSGDQPTVQMTPAADTPNYAAAAGETTVVSNQNAGDAQQSQQQPQYRPAPEYGAYGPTPTQPQQPQQQPQQSGAQTNPNQPFGGLFGQQNPMGQSNPTNGQQHGGHNPFRNPFLAGQQNQNNGQGQQGQNPQNQGQQNGSQPPFPPFGANGPMTNGSQPGRPGASQGSKTVNGVIVAVVAALVSAALCLGVGYTAITNGWVKVPTTSSLTSVDSNKSGSGSATVKSGESVDWTSVASSVSDSVVSIQTVLSNGTAKGSGAILDTDGHIITNNHVISGAQQIQVTLANGTMYSAQVVGTDSTTDLAVIKLDNPPSDLKPVEFADSDKLAVGENVMAIGNPLGYDDTATTGIVSALNRPVTVTDDNNNEVVTNAVQIDAAINPGNSGGPTFNGAGQVIGINSSIASTATSSDSAGSIGIGFAIPSNLVKRVANEIVKDGSVKHVALGVTIKSATVEADGVTRGGAQITTPSTGGSAVVSGGPADKAGLKVNDTIVAFNGNAVNNNYSLLGYVRAAALGDKVTLTIVRDGKTMDVDVTLDQEESSVNGSGSSKSNGNNQNNQNDQNGNGSNGYGNGSDGYGNGSNGQNGGGSGDDGGFSDPFGLW